MRIRGHALINYLVEFAALRFGVKNYVSKIFVLLAPAPWM